MARKDAQPGKAETAAQRRLDALELRKAGLTYRAIGGRLGVSEAQAYQDVKAALATLAQLEQESADELRRIELDRLDALLGSLWGKATTPTEKGQAVAVDRVLAIMERRSKLLGLDAPTRQDVKSAGEQIIRVVYEDDAPVA